MRIMCPRCNTRMKESSQELWGVKDLFTINFCPKCELFRSYLTVAREGPIFTTLLPIIALKGRALGGIDDRTGEFSLSLEGSKIVREGAEMTFKIFPIARETKEKGIEVYPELKQGDEVIAAGFHTGKNRPLISVILKNLTNGMTTTFVDEQIEIKKGFLQSFIIRHPFLVQAEKMIEAITQHYS